MRSRRSISGSEPGRDVLVEAVTADAMDANTHGTARTRPAHPAWDAMRRPLIRSGIAKLPERIWPPSHRLIVTTTIPETRESVTIEVSSNDESPNRKINGTVQEFAGNSLTLLSGEEIAASAAVKVQSKDRLYLGEVVRSVPERQTNWAVYVRLRRTIMIV